MCCCGTAILLVRWNHSRFIRSMMNDWLRIEVTWHARKVRRVLLLWGWPYIIKTFEFAFTESREFHHWNFTMNLFMRRRRVRFFTLGFICLFLIHMNGSWWFVGLFTFQASLSEYSGSFCNLNGATSVPHYRKFEMSSLHNFL